MCRDEIARAMRGAFCAERRSLSGTHGTLGAEGRGLCAEGRGLGGVPSSAVQWVSMRRYLHAPAPTAP